jgi:putative phosphoesterase
MRLGVLSDLHGNRPALEAVAADLPADLDGLVCAGDVVGYNPWPAACIEWIRERGVPTVAGNHDRAVAADTAFRFNSQAAAGVEYAREQLRDEQQAWLDGLPTGRRAIDGRVKLVHGHPEDPDRYTYPDEFGPDLLGDEDVLVMGHTHVPGHEVYDEGIVMNPGSVGQPRDGDPRAAYAVLDLDADRVTQHRVEYDVDEVVAAVNNADLPERIGSRLRTGR